LDRPKELVLALCASAALAASAVASIPMGGFHYATGGTQASSLRDIGWGASVI
jgi:hypothetical protein